MQLPRGPQATAKLHRDWLRELPRQTGKPLTRIAKELGIAASTLTRPLKEGDDGISTLHAATIAKIIAHTGVAPPNVAGTPPQGRRASLGFGEDASPFQPATSEPLATVIAALIAGRNSVTAWTLRTRAVELAGALPGDVLLLDLNATPQPGDMVCAQVYDWQRQKPETVVRVFEKAGPISLLVPRSIDPSLQQPFVVDGERVLIKGVFLPHRLRRPVEP